MINRVIGSYSSAETLLSCMMSSLNLPIFGYPLKNVGGDYYIDGGITNNHPRIDAHTVLCSPFRTSEHEALDGVHITCATAPGIVEFVVPGDRAFMEGLGKQGGMDARRQHGALVAMGFRELETDAPPNFRFHDHPRGKACFFRKLRERVRRGEEPEPPSLEKPTERAPTSLVVRLQEAYLSCCS